VDKRAFRKPATEYRGIALWMLNDKLETKEIVRQLKGIHKAGWGAVIGRTFVGLRTDYLGDEWMRIIGAIIKKAEKLGMRVWLQAGHMPSAVPNLSPAMAHKGLGRRPVGQPLGAAEELLGSSADFQFFARTEPTVLDLLNGEAVMEYLDLAYEQPWRSRFGEHFGKTVEAVWVDEPHFRPPLLPWCDRLPEEFRRQWGYNLAEHLSELYAQVGDYRKVRHQYWRTVTGMFVDGYFKRVGQWCREHDIKFSGHLMGEDTLNNQIAWTGAAMPCYQHMQLPGIDHLTMSLRWPSGKKFLLTPKQCSSVTSQRGIPEALAEIFGVSSQGITFEDRKQIAQWMMVLGINYRCYHGSFYSLRGRRKRVYVPHLSHQQPWWSDNHVIAEPFSRLSYALRRGTTRADVLVIHPVESVMCLYDPTTMERPHDRSTEAADVRDLDTYLVNLCDHLQQIHRGWEFGDESIMAEQAQVVQGGIQVGKMTYRTVVLSSMLTIRRSTLDLLRKFMDAGGTVLAAGTLPTRIDGVEDASLRSLLAQVTPVENTPSALDQALATAAPAELKVVACGEGDPADVWVHERQIDDGRLLFLTNTNRSGGVRAEVRLKCCGTLENWNLETGKVAQAPHRAEGGWVVVPLTLAPVGSCLWLLREGRKGRRVVEKKWTVVRTTPLEGQGRIRRHAPNVLTLDTCRWRKGNGAWNYPLPTIGLQTMLDKEAYRGPLSMEFTFHVDAVPENLCVVVEDAERYDIRVNGQAVDYAGMPHYVDESFHPVDIRDAVQLGVNTIELSIAFEPVPRATFALASLYENTPGVELESIYLIGDFAVRAAVSKNDARPRCVRLSPQFALAKESNVTTRGELVAAGYPFYAGRMSITHKATLDAPAEGQRVVLELAQLQAVLAKVRVNGCDMGTIAWAPYETDITDAVRGGENEIEIELVTSLRNLLGPHHRSNGEPDNTWRTAFDYNPNVNQNAEHAEELANQWVDDYFVLEFGLGGPAKVKYLSPER
jgi:hypothetical protein